MLQLLPITPIITSFTLKPIYPLALELEADRMSNLLLRQQDFDPEIKVVMEERRLRTLDL